MAWVTLDGGDNDPVRLWRYVATAVDRVRPGLGRRALRRQGVAGGAVEAPVDELMNGAGALGCELVVVLDDLDAVTSEGCLSSIDYALGRLPSNLVLAWLWLQTVKDPARAVRAFGGDNRFVADYLSGEVLASLDDDARAFLYGVAVLGEFTAEMCDAVLARIDSAARLVELEWSNLFVSRLERGGWFRIHSLFAAYARTQLSSPELGVPAVIHRRAAVWLRLQGAAAEALRHAAAAGDHELVAELMVEHHLALIRGGSGRTVLRWVRTLPQDQLVQHPELAAAAAAAAMLVGGRRLEQRRLLALSDRGSQARPEQADGYVETATALVRAITIDRGWGRRCSTVDGRSSWRKLTRVSFLPGRWSPMPAPCSSPAS